MFVLLAMLLLDDGDVVEADELLYEPGAELVLLVDEDDDGELELLLMLASLPDVAAFADVL